MLKGTKTETNLLTAFAGECQALTRYQMYAKIAKKEGYVQIANFFLETARNEEEHAKLFYRALKGGAVTLNGTYPAGVIGDTAYNLEWAAKGEGEEADDLYPLFAKTAKEEGFLEVGALFTRIATIEKHHQQRYLKLLKHLKEGFVFKRKETVTWVCLECGYHYQGKEAPKVCPVCNHPQGYYQVDVENY